MTPAIGEALRSAREAQGRSLDEAAAATLIKPSCLEALEQERFGDLGGGVYVKGFLRAYAGYLGLDPAPLVEAYRAQEQPEPVFAHAPRAGGLGGGRRGPSWLVTAIACVTVILAVSLWGLVPPGSESSAVQPPFMSAPAPVPAATAPRPTPATTTRAAPRMVTVTLRYAAASWTRVTADGRVAFEGTPGPDRRRTFRARRSLELTLGYPAGVRLTVNGHDLGVPDRSGNIWRHAFTSHTGSLRDGVGHRGP